MDWLMEPVPFPGMTFDIGRARQRYQEEKARRRATRTLSEQGEQPSNEPDELLKRNHGGRVHRGQAPPLTDRFKSNVYGHDA